MIKKILLAVEEFELAQKSLSKTIALAKTLNAKLALVTVVNSDIIITQESALIFNELKENLKLSSKNLISELKNKFDLEGVEIFIEEGTIVETILNKSKEWEADLLVVGTHARKGIDKWILGSIGEQVVAKADIPVLVISKNVK